MYTEENTSCNCLPQHFKLSPYKEQLVNMWYHPTTGIAVSL